MTRHSFFLLSLASLIAGCSNPKPVPTSPSTIVAIELIKASISAPGTRMWICPQTTPEGWVLVDTRATVGCGSGPSLHYEVQIMCIEGYPSKTQIDVCSVQPNPKGWITIGNPDKCICCTFGGQGWGYKKTIEKL